MISTIGSDVVVDLAFINHIEVSSIQLLKEAFQN